MVFATPVCWVIRFVILLFDNMLFKRREVIDEMLIKNYGNRGWVFEHDNIYWFKEDFFHYILVRLGRSATIAIKNGKAFVGRIYP